MTLPPPPNVHAVAVLILAVVALILFTREKIPLESSSFLVLIGLAVGFELFPFQVDGRRFTRRGLFPGFRTRGAGCRLRPDDCRTGNCPHGGAGTRGKGDGTALEGESEPFPAVDPCGWGLYQRVHKQCPRCRIVSSHFDQRFPAYGY